MESGNKIVDKENEKSPEEIVKEFQKKQELKRNIFIGIAILLACVWAYNSGYSNTNTYSQTNNTDPTPELIDTSWMPNGFNDWTEPNIAWRWLKNNEYNCYGDSCWAVMIIAKNGCDRNLYAEISILDKSDVQVGYTNASVSQALPMQKSKLVFNSFEKSAHSARLTKISCN